MEEKLSLIIEDIFDYLEKKNRNGQYPARTFYGETFTALGMMIYNKDKYKNNIDNIIDYYIFKKDKSKSNFHWEFNNYALINLNKELNDNRIRDNIHPLKFKGTKCSNWTILRGLTRIIANEKKNVGYFEIFNKIIFYQNKNGLIKDDKYVNSFQYHCFMIFLIIKAYEITGFTFLKKSFLKGVEFAKTIILRNGDNNYIGRGQEQIFGYGPLLYSLEKAYNLTEDIDYKVKQNIVFENLIKYQRPNGSFPLVLRKNEKSFPKKIDPNNNEYLGWYAYNNYFDYLPFLGYFLAELSLIYKNVEISEVEDRVESKSYFDGEYLLKRKNNYDFFISKPVNRGYLTNEMPMPYIVDESTNLTPCYGGEEFNSDLYSIEGIPLPYGKIIRNNLDYFNNMIYKIIKFGPVLSNVKKLFKNLSINNNPILDNYYFRNELKFSLNINGIKGSNNEIVFKRNFDINDCFIKITNVLKFKKRMKFNIIHLDHLLFFNLERKTRYKYISSKDGKNLIIELDNKFEYSLSKRNNYCAQGALDSIDIILEDVTFEKNEVIKIEHFIFYEDEC